MTGAGKAVLLAAIVASSALAGCAGDEPVAANEPVTKGSTSTGAPVTDPTPVVTRPKGTSERWHFHDYWQGNPTITLADLVVTLNATQAPDGTPAFGAILELPHGTIVPPETGFLTINVSWVDASPAPLPMGSTLNLTYKPADSNDYFFAGDVASGGTLILNTTESNCDVPHRQVSAWRFNLSAKPGAGTPPTPPAAVKEARFVVSATIGRPLFIDPPHLDWWRNGDILTIVADGNGSISTARTPQGNATLAPPTGVPSSIPTVASLQETARVPVDAGAIVPEGTKSIVAMLNWTGGPLEPADQKLTLRYAESNYPTEGPMELKVDGAAARVFVLGVAQAQTDTTYSNRTTWEFRVVPDGEPASAFHGSFTLVAWASRLSPDATLAALTAAPS